MATMDHLLAQSLAVRASHRPTQPQFPSLAVDDIPRLARSLHQMHADSQHRVLKAGAASPALHVPSSTYRLFARLGIDHHRLHAALDALDRMSAFIDDTVQRPLPLPFNKQPLWLTPRAVDDSRLALNARLRAYMDSVLEDDVDAARPAVIANYSFTSTSDNRLLPAAAHDPGDLRTYENVYLNDVWNLVFQYDAVRPDFSSQLLTTCAQNADLPHLKLSLDILSRLRSFDENSVIWSSRHVLEDEFARQIPQLPQYPRNADALTVIEAIEHFVSNNQNSDSQQNGDANSTIHIPNRPSAWVCIYLCLRCGAVHAARHLLERTNILVAKFFAWFMRGSQHITQLYKQSLQKDVSEDDIQVDDSEQGELQSPSIAGCILNLEQYEEILEEYHNACMSYDDPYMRACYILLLRIDSNNSNSALVGSHEDLPSLHLNDNDFDLVFPTVEDYLWLNLWVCRTPIENSLLSSLQSSKFAPSSMLIRHYSMINISDIRNEILTCGEKHFNPNGNQPLLYSFVLICIGMMKESVLYLYKQNNIYWIHYSVHLFLILYHSLNHFVGEDEEIGEKIIGKYVQMLSKYDLNQAVVYMYTLHDKQVIFKIIREVLIGKNKIAIDSIIGRKSDSGQRVELGSLLSVFADDGRQILCRMDREAIEHDFIYPLARQAASDLEQRGELERAGELCAMHGDMAKVLQLRIQDALLKVFDQDSARRKNCVHLLRQLDVRENALVREIIAIHSTFEEYWTGRYEACWNEMRTTVQCIPVLPGRMDAALDLCRTINRAAHSDANRVAQCIVALVQVALHIAHYALDNDSVATTAADHHARAVSAAAARYTGQRYQNYSTIIPTLDEIKNVCAFATLLKIEDETIGQRLIHIEKLVSVEQEKEQ